MVSRLLNFHINKNELKLLSLFIEWTEQVIVLVVVWLMSVFLSRNVKHISCIQITVYSVYVLGCEIFSISIREGYYFRAFDNKAFNRIFGQKK